MEPGLLLQEGIKLDQLALFYHSNVTRAPGPGIAGICKCTKEGYPDYNAWDRNHPYFDPKSKEGEPTWFMVDVGFVEKYVLPRRS